MIFDDHDIRDDWNTSQRWRSRWRPPTGGTAGSSAASGRTGSTSTSGNLTPDERADDRLQASTATTATADDLGDLLDAFAERADEEPEAYRWSYARDLGAQARLVVVDSRAARVLDPDGRSMLDEDEMALARRACAATSTTC